MRHAKVKLWNFFLLGRALALYQVNDLLRQAQVERVPPCRWGVHRRCHNFEVGHADFPVGALRLLVLCLFFFGGDTNFSNLFESLTKKNARAQRARSARRFLALGQNAVSPKRAGSESLGKTM